VVFKVKSGKLQHWALAHSFVEDKQFHDRNSRHLSAAELSGRWTVYSIRGHFQQYMETPEVLPHNSTAPSCLEKWQRIAQPRCLLVLYHNIAPFVTSCARMDRETKDEAGSLRCPICETDVLALGAKQVLLCWHIY
jgi:hypothetical protein